MTPDSSVFKSFSLGVLNILSSVKSSNAYLIGLLNVSKELIPEKFSSWCLTHAINTTRTTHYFISLDGKTFPIIPTHLLGKEFNPNKTLKFIFEKKSLTKTRLYLFSLFQAFLLVIGVVGVMVAVIPWIAIPVIPFGIAFFFLQRYFSETSRDIKRLECASEYGTLRLVWQSRLAFLYAISLARPLESCRLSSGISH